MATFKAWTNTGTGTGLLSFVSFAACLAKTGTFAVTKTLLAVLGSGVGLEIVESHHIFLLRVLMNGNFPTIGLNRFLIGSFFTAQGHDLVTTAELTKGVECRLDDVGVVV